jgi:hypothetical protein
MGKSVIPLLLALLIPLLSMQGTAEAQERKISSYQVRPGSLSGMVTDAKGKAQAGKKITIVNQHGKVKSSVVTDKRGFYRIKNLPAGQYILQIDGKTLLGLEVTLKAHINSLKFVLPPTVGAGMPLNWTYITAGAVAVAVAIPVIAHSSDSSSSKNVSP